TIIQKTKELKAFQRVWKNTKVLLNYILFQVIMNYQMKELKSFQRVWKNVKILQNYILIQVIINYQMKELKAFQRVWKNAKILLNYIFIYDIGESNQQSKNRYIKKSTSNDYSYY
ncbi:hypothetical protein TTHERM_001230029, partial (macronuclear) [Tetrahymena thermophila SB210]